MRTPDDITLTDSRGLPIDLNRSMYYSADSSRGDSAYNQAGDPLTILGQIGEAIVGPFEEWRKNVMLVMNDPQDRYSATLLAIIWIGFGFTYYGLILFVSRLYRENDGDDSSSGSLQTCSFDYGDIMLNASSEIPGTAMAMLIIDYMGRRITQSGFYLVGTFCLILMGAMFFAALFLWRNRMRQREREANVQRLVILNEMKKETRNRVDSLTRNAADRMVRAVEGLTMKELDTLVPFEDTQQQVSVQDVYTWLNFLKRTTHSRATEVRHQLDMNIDG